VTKYNRIKAELAEHNRQNKELAHYLGVHETTVSDWCTTKNQPAIQDLFLIAKFLRMDVRLLLVSTTWEPEMMVVAEPGKKEKNVTKKKAAKKK
jgi:transcriptional regulator with XRE-family HTH domain